MKETIYNLLAQQGDMTWQQITMHILVSAVIGLFIFISYVISHKGTIYSKKFGVTEDSIRKDLAHLEKDGMLKKTYGGAVRVRTNSHDRYVSQRIGKNVEEKRVIAKRAYEIIQDGDVIFLDISTINIELVKLIVEADRPVTVVTNMIDAILIMLHEKDTKTKLIFLGGKLNRGRDGFVGTITNRNISNYQFDKAFMGVVGIEVNRNRVYTYDTEDALTKKSVMEVSNECYMLMEREKLSKDGNYKYAGIDEFTGLIMEESVEGTIMSKLKSYNIDIYC